MTRARGGEEPGEGGVGQPPPGSTPAESASEVPGERTYTVISGDTLTAIADRFYGDGSKDQMIAEANGIPNPDLIHPGQVLTIP